MAAPGPIARTSGSSTPLQHPSPANYLLRRSMSSTHASLVQRLEGSAEEMSAGGSDIAEEIRKMNEEQKERSRQNSVERDGARAGRLSSATQSSRSRASSQNTSILDVARWGGYSPNGFVSSPVESVRSHGSQPKTNALSRRVSGTGSSRLAHMVEPTQEGRPLDSPLGVNVATFASPPSRHASQSSFALRYDQIASQIEESLENVPPSPQKEEPNPNVQDALLQLEGDRTGIARARSMDTFQEIEQAFKDFDGVHYNQDTDELITVDENGNEIRRVSAHSTNGGFSLEVASMLRQPRDFSNPGAPPPAQGMVYYPAPVPRMLNLPKRLSLMPPSEQVARRRTRVLSQYPSELRASAPWLSESSIDVSDTPNQPSGSGTETNGGPRGMINERMSVANFHNVPPQLRASVFFDHQSVVHNVEIKRQSAMATLDSILAASATAPVNAFLDHPYAGDVRKSVFAPEVKKVAQRSSTALATAASDESRQKMHKKRSSSIGRLFRRSTSNDLEVDSDGNRLARRKSRLSLGGELDRQSRPPTPGNELASLRSETVLSGRDLSESEQIERDFEEQEELENVDLEEGEDGEAAAESRFVKPATLLAELQVRKAQQKSRNKTAATAFPNGMHSTLLEMDAVEEINNKKRRQHRPTLAWEDPALAAQNNDDEDEDVPLGMLFPSKDGATTRKTGDLRDWDRPLGLMEKRHLEDNEPLSSRRNRLRGISPTKARAMALANRRATQAQFEEDEEDEHAGETLGQRSRRLKTKSVLDSAISDVAPANGERPISTFTDDVLSQFGGLDAKDPAAEAPVDPENETLGQRRARLQREAAAAGNDSKPPLKSRASFGTLLSQNPTGLRQSSREHKLAEGTLLHADQIARNKQKEDVMSSNFRASRFEVSKPLVENRPFLNRQPSSTGLLGQQQSAALQGGFAGGKYNNGAGGVFASPTQPQPGTFTPYFASPTAHVQNPAMFNPAAYQALNGGGHMSTFGLPGMYPQQYGAQQMMPLGMNMGMPMNMGVGVNMKMPVNMNMNMAMGLNGLQYDPDLDTKQRDMIDRWRMAVP